MYVYEHLLESAICIGKRVQHICILRANVIVFRYVESQQRKTHMCDKRLPNMNIHEKKQMQKERIHMYPTSIHDHVEIHTFIHTYVPERGSYICMIRDCPT